MSKFSTNRILKVTIFALLLVAASLTVLVVAAQDNATEAPAATESDSMAPTIVQINYTFAGSRADHTELVTPMAEPIAGVPGLIWKIWLMNEGDNEAGGIYLFESREAAEAFVGSQGIADFSAHPMISDLNAKMFEAVESLSLITRGPLSLPEPE
jgi:hypothetical protein